MAPDIKFDKEKIYEAIKAEFDLPYWQEQFDRLHVLKDEGINPFKTKADGTPEGWSKLVEAQQILSDIVHHAIVVAEKVCADAAQVGRGQDKAEAVAKWLDDVIALPFYLEPFDGPLIKLIISNAVKLLEKVFGKDWLNKVPVPTPH